MVRPTPAEAPVITTTPGDGVWKKFMALLFDCRAQRSLHAVEAARTLSIETSGVLFGRYPYTQCFPGRTLASNSLALFFSTLPSSGSDGIMLTKCLASSSVM